MQHLLLSIRRETCPCLLNIRSTSLEFIWMTPIGFHVGIVVLRIISSNKCVILKMYIIEWIWEIAIGQPVEMGTK